MGGCPRRLLLLVTYEGRPVLSRIIAGSVCATKMTSSPLVLLPGTVYKSYHENLILPWDPEGTTRANLGSTPPTACPAAAAA